MSSHKNRVKMTVTGTPGTGTITLSAASSGYQSLATAYGANATVDLLYTDAAGVWGVERDCGYVHSGTTITRGTAEDGSSGAGVAVSLTSAAVVSVIATADKGTRIETALQSVTPGGRLTLESGVPVSTTDQTAKTSVYYTPYIHNIVNLWDGTNWVPTTFTEKTLALGTLTSGKPYDVFGYLSSGALVLDTPLAWTNDTTRATAVTLQDGRYCKNGDKTRLLLGTFYTTATTTTEDSAQYRYLYNTYNQKQRRLFYDASALGSHTYASTTFREYNASTVRVAIINGIAGGNILVGAGAYTACAASGSARVGIGENSTSTVQGYTLWDNSSTVSQRAAGAPHSAPPAVGYSYYAALEASLGGTSSFDACRISGAWLC